MSDDDVECCSDSCLDWVYRETKEVMRMEMNEVI